MVASIVEYLWLDAFKGLRSKIRVIPRSFGTAIPALSDIPKWNYDGSSTGQSATYESEIVIVPQFVCHNPSITRLGRPGPPARAYIALCDTYTTEGKPTPSNTRHVAAAIFKHGVAFWSEPWFGFEQEYFLGVSPLAASPPRRSDSIILGASYCGVGSGNVFGRQVAETHMQHCLRAGLQVSGINAEVAPGQWEFQIGPVTGIEAADQLIVARYLLQKVAEAHDTSVIWHPKPWPGHNGSGCHTNYSTRDTREGTHDMDGLSVILEHGRLLGLKHAEHMEIYGESNRLRMTGTNETARFDTFSIGIGDRSASVRVGNDTAREGKGYYEDSR